MLPASPHPPGDAGAMVVRTRVSSDSASPRGVRRRWGVRAAGRGYRPVRGSRRGGRHRGRRIGRPSPGHRDGRRRRRRAPFEMGGPVTAARVDAGCPTDPHQRRPSHRRAVDRLAPYRPPLQTGCSCVWCAGDWWMAAAQDAPTTNTNASWRRCIRTLRSYWTRRPRRLMPVPHAATAVARRGDHLQANVPGCPQFSQCRRAGIAPPRSGRASSVEASRSSIEFEHRGPTSEARGPRPRSELDGVSPGRR
jgi:hypothetical protein